jgi:hypothetical protein
MRHVESSGSGFIPRRLVVDLVLDLLLTTICGYVWRLDEHRSQNVPLQPIRRPKAEGGGPFILCRILQYRKYGVKVGGFRSAIHV